MSNWKILTLAGLLSLVSVPLLAGQAGETFGAGVTLPSATGIDSLLTAPEANLGKKVKVEGVISAMCEKSGCWMQLTDSATNKGLRIAFEEGVVKIPLTAMGHKATAEGTFEVNASAIPNTPEAQHEANCPYAQKAAQQYQIKATGAVVYP